MGKQGRKVLAIHVNPLVPTPSPSYYRRQKKNAHMPHTYTQARTHARTQIIKCPTHNIPETIFKLLSVNKQTPTYSSDRIDADVEIEFSSHWVLSSVVFPSRVPFNVFLCMIQTVYMCNPTSIQYFLNTPGRRYSFASEILETA